jgi:hypothetical protein
MSEKIYKQRTKVLGIPVVGYHDKIWPEIELKKYQLIENMLLAAMKGIDNCLFEEGDMRLNRQEDGNFSVVLHPIGVTRSAVGILGGTYFKAPPSVEWNNLEVGKVHYLYLTKTQKTLVDPTSIRTFTSEYMKQVRGSILMGVVDLKSDTPVLERYPDEKLYTSDLAEHLLDNHNPHGDVVTQNELDVTKKLALETDTEIKIGDISVPASVLIPKTIDFITGGSKGVVLSTSSKVVFVQVCRLSGSPGNLGETSIGYFEKDEKVPNEKTFIVYNVGDSDIPMKAIVFYG